MEGVHCPARRETRKVVLLGPCFVEEPERIECREHGAARATFGRLFRWTLSPVPEVPDRGAGKGRAPSPHRRARHHVGCGADFEFVVACGRTRFSSGELQCDDTSGCWWVRHV